MRGIYLTYFCNNPGNGVAPCRSELAREALKGNAFIQDARVSVEVLREQARSYSKEGLACEHRVGEQPEVQQIQAKVRGNRRAEPAKAIGQAVTHAGNTRQQHPLPTRSKMHQAE